MTYDSSTAPRKRAREEVIQLAKEGFTTLKIHKLVNERHGSPERDIISLASIRALLREYNEDTRSRIGAMPPQADLAKVRRVVEEDRRFLEAHGRPLYSNIKLMRDACDATESLFAHALRDLGLDLGYRRGRQQRYRRPQLSAERADAGEAG